MINNICFISVKNIYSLEKIGRQISTIIGALVFSYMGMFYSYTSHQLFKFYPDWLVSFLTLFLLINYVFVQRMNLKKAEKKLLKLEFDLYRQYDFFITSNFVSSLKPTYYSLIVYIIFLFFESESNTFSLGLNKWIFDVIY